MRVLIIFLLLSSITFLSADKSPNAPLLKLAKRSALVNNAPPAIYGVQNLRGWNAWKKNPTSRYDWLLIGDSYTQGNYYSGILRDKLLADGYKDGGPGYCSLGRWDPVEAYSIDGSIDADELTFTYNTRQWESIKENTFGPCDHVKATVANAAIHVTSKVALNTLTLIYERHPQAGSFRYRVNKGTWQTASANSPGQGIGGIIINVASSGKNIDLEIQSLAAGQIFCGVLAKRTGNVLAIHKLGSSGTPASFFARNPLWEASTKILSPKGATIMFGINEQGENVTPAAMRVSVQNIINKIRKMSPQCDIVLMCPLETEYEKEKPHKYKIVDYGTMLYQLAIANKAAFIDHSKVFGHFSQALVDNKMMETDRIHPGPQGGPVIANTIYSVFK